MIARKRLTAEDRVQAMRTALSGDRTAADLGDSRLGLSPLRPKDNMFPGEVFFELAARMRSKKLAPRSSISTASTRSGPRS